MAQEGVAPDLRPDSHYELPDALRGELAAEFGPIHQKNELPRVLADAPFVVAVGDVVSLTLNQLGIKPDVFVCDYITERGKGTHGFQAFLGKWGEDEVRAANPAGQITRAAWDAMREAIAAPGMTRVVVDGEEDLLGMVAFLEAPPGARVLYGAPGKGVVVVTVDDAMRERAARLLERFERH